MLKMLLMRAKVISSIVFLLLGFGCFAQVASSYSSDSSSKLFASAFNIYDDIDVNKVFIKKLESSPFKIQNVLGWPESFTYAVLDQLNTTAGLDITYHQLHDLVKQYHKPIDYIAPIAQSYKVNIAILFLDETKSSKKEVTIWHNPDYKTTIFIGCFNDNKHEKLVSLHADQKIGLAWLEKQNIRKVKLKNLPHIITSSEHPQTAARNLDSLDPIDKPYADQKDNIIIPNQTNGNRYKQLYSKIKPFKLQVRNVRNAMDDDDDAFGLTRAYGCLFNAVADQVQLRYKKNITGITLLNTCQNYIASTIGINKDWRYISKQDLVNALQKISNTQQVNPQAIRFYQRGQGREVSMQALCDLYGLDIVLLPANGDIRWYKSAKANSKRVYVGITRPKARDQKAWDVYEHYVSLAGKTNLIDQALQKIPPAQVSQDTVNTNIVDMFYKGPH